MHLNTYPCDVNPCHALGLIEVRCVPLGWCDVFITDDFGHLQSVCDPEPIYVHMSN